MANDGAIQARVAIDEVIASRAERNKDFVRTIIDRPHAEGRTSLTAPEDKLVCDAYGITVPKERLATSAAQAARLADEMGYPVVLKIVSPGILPTFGCIGPVIASGLDWARVRVITKLDGVERQNYPLSDMVFPPAELVSRISHDMTLMPGDVIACGTSVGVGSIRDGSTVEITVDGIGTLTNTLGER